MLIASLLVTFGLYLAPQTGAPVVLKASRVDGNWLVPVTIDDREPMSFIVDSGARPVVWEKPGAKGTSAETHKVVVGSSISLLGLELSRRDFPALADEDADRKAQGNPKEPIGGLLGLDVLEHFAVGFDLQSWEISLFPSDSSEATLGTWVNGVSRSEDPARHLELKKAFGGLFGTQITVAGKPVPALVDSGSTENTIADGMIPRDFADVFESQGFGAFAGDERLIVANDPWAANEPWTYWASSSLKHLGDAPDCKAILSLTSFGSRRVLLDFRRGHILLEPYDAEVFQSVFLSDLLGMPMRVAKGGGLVADQGFLGIHMPIPAEYDHAAILRVGDVDGPSITASLINPSRQGRELIAKVAKLANGKCDVILGPESKPFTLHISRGPAVLCLRVESIQGSRKPPAGP